jgi:hypothetical protein
MTNLHILKKHNVAVGKAIKKAKEKKRWKHVHNLQFGRVNLKEKIAELRKRKPKRK